MMTPHTIIKSSISTLFMLQLLEQVSAGTQFTSHISINTPVRSFTHGVGNPVSMHGSRNYNRQPTFRSLSIPKEIQGYPQVKPAIPFTNEDIGSRSNRFNSSPWRYNNYMEVAIPLLPQSPYKVDSPDPESTWPEGLLLQPFNPPRFAASSNRRSEVLSGLCAHRYSE